MHFGTYSTSTLSGLTRWISSRTSCAITGEPFYYPQTTSPANATSSLHVQRLNQEDSPKPKRPLDMKFEPKKTELDKPKFGKEDPNNDPHEGGNTWAGGVRLCTCAPLEVC